jgi:SAM-dependent methyltransferase
MNPELKNNLVKTYDRYADDRDKREIAPWKIQEQDHFITILKEKQKKTLLEIGAGTGNDSALFQDRGFAVMSTDMSPEMVRFCREKGLSAFIMDFYHLGFREASFDAIWALNCLLHVSKEDLREVLQGIKTVLKPRGLFYLGVWGGIEFEGVWKDDSYTPQRFFAFYPDQRLQAVVADFFEVLYFRPIFIEGRELHFQSMILGK